MNNFKTSLLYCFIFFTFGCSPQISNYYESTRYVESFYTHIINDSLQLYLRTPSDIEYEQNSDSIQNYLRNEKRQYSGIMAYGKTKVPPEYEFYIMLDPEKILKAKNNKQFARDTLINGHRLAIFCQSKEKYFSTSFKSDCRRIFSSISTDKNYRNGISSMSDLAKRSENRYYQGLKAILDYPVKGRNEEFLQLQMALNFASFLAPSSIYYKLLNKFPTPPVKDSLKQAIKSELIQGFEKTQRRIFREAKKHQLVMFNENHFYPNHRKILISWLQKFKKLGFSYLALEALGAGQDSLLNKGQPPTIHTGFYTKDPHFAELIREAQNLDFTFVSYENTDPEKNRERGQASNLFNKTFAQNDSARVLVLAGLDHILEKPDSNGKHWLAHILRQEYNLAPLTISQSHLNEYHNLGKPIALLKSSQVENDHSHPVDWYLLNNIPLYDQSPNFSYYNPHNQKVQIALFLNSDIGTGKKFRNKIPYRTRLVAPGQTIEFKLPKKQLYMAIYNGEGRILSEKKVQKHYQ